MEIISGVSAHLPPQLLTALAHYRYQVFVKKLGWPLQCQDNLEFDDFDKPDTIYVIALNASKKIIGSTRLLPTTRPYLLEEVFPQLVASCPPPKSPEVWELSRFSAIDLDAPDSSYHSSLASSVSVGLLRTSMQCAAKRGAKRLITVSPLGVERLLHKLGFQARRGGPTTIIDGVPIFACWIECAHVFQPETYPQNSLYSHENGTTQLMPTVKS
jgi:N-acyl-L-homoserine lactone synthetase